MNIVCRRIWNRDMSVRRWAELNGFSYHTSLQVIRGTRGAWGAGVSKKIISALVDQGLMTKQEAEERVKL